MAAPSLIVWLLSIALIDVLAARLLSNRWYGAAAAALFASTPLVWFAARAGSNALDQLPIVIGWLFCIDLFRSKPNALNLAAAGGVLALGLYTSPGAIVTMPVLLALSVVVLVAPGGLAVDRRLGAMLAAVVAFAIPFMMYLVLHPEYLRGRIVGYGLYDADRYNVLQGAREMFSWVGLTARTEVYYDSFNPALLFLSGRGIVKSLTNPQVFLLPFAVLLVVGFHRILTRPGPGCGSRPFAWSPSCLTSFSSPSASVCCCCWGFTPAASAGCEAIAMFELIFGLAVALGLAVYLVLTLLAPERF